MRESLAEVHEFDLAVWRVKPSAGLLSCAGVERRVPPRLMRLLLVLVSRPRQVLSKQELLDRVWDNEDASDESLSVSISQLRKALGDDSSRPRYIETIPKRGYRMLVDARFPCATAGPGAAGERPPGTRTASHASLANESASERAAGAAADDAEKIYSRGQALLPSHSSRNLWQAKLYFERALALKPRFAAAHAALACVHMGLLYNQEPGSAWAEHARCNARAAVKIDPSFGWGRAVQAVVHGFVDNNFAAADEEFQKAFALQPDLVVSRRRYALLLAAMKRPDEALQQLAEATRHDPLDISAQQEVAHIFFMVRQYDRAVEELLQFLGREPRSWSAYAKLAFVHWMRGDASAVHATYRAAAHACDTQTLVARIDAAFSAEGAAGIYATVASHLEARNPARRYHSTELITAHIAAGHYDRAIQLLDSGCRAANRSVIWMLRSPSVDTLQSHTAFAQLVSRYAPEMQPSPDRDAPTAQPKASVR